jgi:uncharacterized protein YndB with AHSA1/START domain
MTAASKTQGLVPKNRVMSMTRTLNAPRELVWEVYTQPEHMVHWLASNDWTTPSAEVDLRPGGRHRVEMRPLEGGEGFFFEGVYDEIVEPELLVLRIGDGRIMRTTLEDLGGSKTKLTIAWEMAEAEELERQGYSQILDKLAAYVVDRRPDKPEIIITREFEAPREVVFKAWTDPAQLRQWFGPNGFSVPTAESDPRPGGVFRVVMRFSAGDGKDYPSTGTYREVIAPERIVMTMAGEGADGSITDSLLTLTFTERAGKTLLILHHTAGAGKGLGGAAEGWKQSLDKLAKLIAA